MKLTKPDPDGASQLVPGVRRVLEKGLVMRVCAAWVVAGAFLSTAPLAAQGTASGAQDDAVVGAVVKAIVKSRGQRFCVGVSRGDHGWQGPWEMPSEQLQKRLSRTYRNVGFPQGPRPCYSPFYVVGPIAPVTGQSVFEVTVMDVEHPDMNGPDHYSVRRNWLGKWSARQNCCKE
jgi:hypothetical protein